MVFAEKIAEASRCDGDEKNPHSRRRSITHFANHHEDDCNREGTQRVKQILAIE